MNHSNNLVAQKNLDIILNSNHKNYIDNIQVQKKKKKYNTKKIENYQNIYLINVYKISFIIIYS